MDNATTLERPPHAALVSQAATNLRLGLPRVAEKLREKYQLPDDAAAEIFGEAEARNDGRAGAPKLGLTDLGNARRLVHRHGEDLRYVNGLGWFVWDGRRWASDAKGEIVRRAKKTAIGIFEEAASDAEDDRRKKLAAWAIRSEGRAALSNMVALAESEPSIAIVADDLDADPWKLNVANGTVDLRSGELRRHDPAELHTKIAGAAYNAGATAPLWEKILAEILPDAEVRAFVQRYMGYCLTGSVREQCLAFLWGAGSNGKTTFLEAIREAMGDCAHQAGGDLLVAKRERGAGDMAAVASLRGRRLVTTIEVDDGVRLAEGLVKELTGERRVTAKLMRRDPIEFENVSKLCLAANHKPEVRGQDYAMWRRIKLIPFDVTIPDERKDADLGPKLAQERDGILGWLVEGCLAYQREGLREPAVIKAATAEYRDESNQLRDWLDECTEAVAGASTPTAQLRDDYISWAERERIRAPLKPTKFGTALTDAGFPGGKSNGVRVRHGIRLTRGGDRGGLAV